MTTLFIKSKPKRKVGVIERILSWTILTVFFGPMIYCIFYLPAKIDHDLPYGMHRAEAVLIMGKPNQEQQIDPETCPYSIHQTACDRAHTAKTVKTLSWNYALDAIAVIGFDQHDRIVFKEIGKRFDE